MRAGCRRSLVRVRWKKGSRTIFAGGPRRIEIARAALPLTEYRLQLFKIPSSSGWIASFKISLPVLLWLSLAAIFRESSPEIILCQILLTHIGMEWPSWFFHLASNPANSLSSFKIGMNQAMS